MMRKKEVRFTVGNEASVEPQATSVCCQATCISHEAPRKSAAPGALAILTQGLVAIVGAEAIYRTEIAQLRFRGHAVGVSGNLITV